MDQETLKEKLLKYSPYSDFTVIYSGKKSKKIDGTYYSDKKEIVINNKNFKDDSSLMYTGLHELAHHIDFTKDGPRRMAHAGEFPSILSNLVNKAIEGGDFTPLKHEVIDKAISANKAYTEAMKELGKALLDCIKLCGDIGYPFEDILSRELGLTKSEAKTIIKVHSLDISPEVGGELAKKLTKVKDPHERKQAEKDLIIKKSKPKKKKEQDEFTKLSLEKTKVKKSIDKLNHKLEEIELKLEEYNRRGPSPLPVLMVPGATKRAPGVRQ